MKHWAMAMAMAGLVAAGCAGVETRVAKNQAYFDGLPVAAQARIRGGEIDVGFTPKMVEIALGEPTERITRVESGLRRDIWRYADTRANLVREQVTMEGAGRGGTTGWITLNLPRGTALWTVEFIGGRVSAYERPWEEGDGTGGALP